MKMQQSTGYDKSNNWYKFMIHGNGMVSVVKGQSTADRLVNEGTQSLATGQGSEA